MPTGQRETQAYPPLFGDGQGRYKILIVGNSGVGKSTLGAELAKILDVPFIPLDKLFWGPGWQKASTEEFRVRTRKALDQSDRGWVVDGSYFKRLGTMMETEATDTIWLDPPLVLYFPRLFLRTVRRLVGLAPPCSPGCLETVQEAFFSQNSILWWCLTHHTIVRKREGERLRTNGLAAGGTYRRMGGWGCELVTWMQSVRDMIRAEGRT